MGIFFLIRHAETDWNLAHRLQGHSDIALNPTGEKQAATLVPFMQSFAVKKIFSSDLKRANTTAIIASAGKIKVQTSADLREINLGDAEGKSWPEVEPLYGKNFVQAWSTNDWQQIENLKFPNGETRGELYNRGRKFFEKILQTETENCAFFTHGLFIRTFVHKVAPDLQTSFRMPNTAVLPFAFCSNNEIIYLGPKNPSEVLVPMHALSIDF